MSDMLDDLLEQAWEAYPILTRRKRKGDAMSKRTSRFHIRCTAKGEYRPYLRAANGEHVAGTETYRTEQGARNWITRLCNWAADAMAQDTVIDKRS
jgi:uncharacterized protein YegP (UPF0339 family)